MTTTKTPSNTSQRFPKPLLKSTKMPSLSLRSTLASASSVMTLASQANGSGGSSRDAAGRRQGDGRWNRSRGQGKRENRLEVEQSGEPLLDTVAVEDVMERATWEEDGLKESRRWEEKESVKWEKEEHGRRQEEEEGGERRREEKEEGGERRREEEDGDGRKWEEAEGRSSQLCSACSSGVP